jgi:hypothetical protein
MNIRQLIDELQKHDPEMRVVTTGYEGGYCDRGEIQEIQINIDVNKGAWYYGPHDDAYGEKFDEIALYI